MNIIKLAGAVAALGLTLTACGGGSEANPPVAAKTESTAAKYAQCMRQNGVPNFPDPDAEGRFNLQIDGRSGGVTPQHPAWKAAETACKDLAPQGQGLGQDPKGAENMLKFAKCMRENGVPNFPDPKGGMMAFDAKSGVDPNSPAFKDAMAKCRSLAPGGMPGA